MPQLAPLYWVVSFLFFWVLIMMVCCVVWWSYSFELRFPSFFVGKNYKDVWKW